MTELTDEESQELKQKQGQEHLQDSSGLELEHLCGRSNIALHQSVYSCKYKFLQICKYVNSCKYEAKMGSRGRQDTSTLNLS